jgi:hypothetical protein
MKMPGLSAEASLSGRSSYQLVALKSADDGNAVVPAQTCCGTVTGPCNGPFGALATGRVSTTVVDGRPNRCFGGWSYAFTNVCRSLTTGATVSRTDGCGFCLF